MISRLPTRRIIQTPTSIGHHSTQIGAAICWCSNPPNWQITHTSSYAASGWEMVTMLPIVGLDDSSARVLLWKRYAWVLQAHRVIKNQDKTSTSTLTKRLTSSVLFIKTQHIVRPGAISKKIGKVYQHYNMGRLSPIVSNIPSRLNMLLRHRHQTLASKTIIFRHQYAFQSFWLPFCD